MRKENMRQMVGAADITCLEEETVYQRAWTVSSQERKDKAAHLKNPADKRRCIASGLLLNGMLAMYHRDEKESAACAGFGAAGSDGSVESSGILLNTEILNFDLIYITEHYRKEFDYQIGYGKNGKPYFRQHPEIFFNLSHSGTMAACCVADRPVGIDIEGGRPCRLKVAQRFFSERERAWVEEAETEHRFFRLWTLKEAYAKADGAGIGQNITKVHFRPQGQRLYFEEVELAQKYGLKEFFYQGYHAAVVCERRKTGRIQLRTYRPEDSAVLAALFYETIHAVNAADYSEEQLGVWADGNTDLTVWNASFLEHFTVVAELDGRISGFGDITQEGYLDRLYVHKDTQRCGIASAVCDVLEAHCGAKVITTHASVTARPFFEKRGYRAVRTQQVERAGILLTNYVMRLER